MTFPHRLMHSTVAGQEGRACESPRHQQGGRHQGLVGLTGNNKRQSKLGLSALLGGGPIWKGFFLWCRNYQIDRVH